MAGPLSFMSNQDSEPPRLESSFVPTSVAMPQSGGMSSRERLSQIKEEVAPDEDPSIADTIKEARMRLLNQATGGVHPFVAYLTAKSRGGVDKYANAADAMNQAYAQRDASEEAKNLKLLDYSIKEGEARASEAKNKADETYRSGMLKVEQDKLGVVEAASPAGKQALDEGFKPGTPEFAKRVREIAAAAAEKPAEKPVGYDSFLQPTSNFNEVAYGNGAEVKKAREQTRKSVIGANMAASVYDEVLKSPNAFGPRAAIVTSLPGIMQNLLSDNDLTSLSPEELRIRTKVFTQAALAIKEFYGVAVSRGEASLASEWQPGKAKSNKQLLENLQAAMEYAAQVNSQFPDEIYSNVGLDEKAVNRFMENRPKFLSGEYFKKPPPQMTKDEAENKRVYDSLNEGDEFRTLNGTLKRKGDD